MRWIREFLKRQELISIFAQVRRPASSSKLYVVDVNFPVKPELAEALQKSFEPLREKYGLEFIVLEPGIRLRRFDDI